jgi:hypothetical protein
MTCTLETAPLRTPPFLHHREHAARPLFEAPSRRSLLRLLLLACALLAIAGGARATTYYIDYASGSNGNDGLAKTTGGGHGPWKSHPYRNPAFRGGSD